MIYGKALNEGRKLFPSDELFGQWVLGNLPITEHKERQAAMWAAENTDLMHKIMEENPRIKTVRGAHTYVRIA